MSINSEGKDHSLIQKRWHCWVTLAGEPAACIRCCCAGSSHAREASSALTSQWAKPWTRGIIPGCTPALLGSFSLKQPQAQVTVISIILMVALRVAAMDKFISSSGNADVPLFSQTAVLLENQKAAPTSTLPILIKCLQRHEPADAQGLPEKSRL